MRLDEAACVVARRCLTSWPAVAAVAVLVVNDHVLKVHMGGVVTGKLSDVAGLVFAPLLVAGLLSVGVRSSVLAGRLGLVLTGAGFVWVKLFPAAAAWASELLTSVFGPSLVRSDPTDLLALPALVVPWLLWRDCSGASAPRGRRQALPVYLVLPVMALATAATSCDHDLASVSAFTVSGTEVTANGQEVSADGGLTWEPTASGTVQFPSSEQVTVCKEDHCFRVAGTPRVEESVAGGPWRVAWEIPPERVPIVQRLNQHGGFCGESGGVAAVDATFAGPGPDAHLVVAMQGEGVLVRTADGDWRQVAVADARPEPFVASSPVAGIAVVDDELLALALVGLFGLWSLLVWTHWLDRDEQPVGGRPQSGGRRVWAALAIIVTVVATAAVAAAGVVIVFLTESNAWMVPSLWMLGAGSAATVHVYRTRSATRVRLTLIALVGMVLWTLAAFVPFLAWATGLIPDYRGAVIGAALVGGTLFAMILSHMQARATRVAGSPDQQ